MTATVIAVDFRARRRIEPMPTWSPNWFAAEYAAAYARLFGSMATAWDDCARKLRATDQTDGLLCDCELPDGSAG